MRSLFVVLSILFLLPSFIIADVPIGDESSKIDFYGYVDFESGQYVRARFQDVQYSHLWLENIHGRLGMQYQPSERLAIRCGAELRVWYNTFPEEKQSDFSNGMSKYFSIYLHEAQGIFKFLDKESIGLNLALGYFPYKYNPEVRDLGEYLFRTGTYPVYIINNFDMPSARLSGMCASLKLGNDLLKLKFDQLVLTEQQIRPFHDVTLASILSANIFKIADLGAGISFAHLFSVDKKVTTPEVSETKYLNDDGDTAYYTFKGTKLMFRTTIDPFGTVRENEGFLGDFVGSAGGKIYGELAMIGLKKYPNNIELSDSSNCTNIYGYDKLNEKMPLMFGFTLPCWKILDVCAVEFEFFNCPYQNDFAKVQQFGRPLPVSRPDTADAYNPKTYKDGDNWKWAVFLRKDINKNFGMVLQLGRDHQRWEWSGFQGLSYDFETAMVKKNEWSWNFKTEFKF